jgi:uncharacterized protein (DUF1778 family)/GNAT superfamily N-acetyltransferase
MPMPPFSWLQKNIRHSIELSHEQDILLRRAAGARGLSVAQFISESLGTAAELAILDQQQFFVAGGERQRMIALRQRHSPPTQTLRRLMAQKAAWESGSALRAPEPLAPAHSIVQFDCGRVAMNDWLTHRARQAQLKCSARTFVVCVQDRVVAYFSLSVGQIDSREIGHGTLPIDQRLFPIPVTILTRLAVDTLYQHKGIGHSLLREAILHTLAINDQAGVEAMLTQPLNEPIAKFYLDCGFQQSPAAYKQLLLPIEDMLAAREAEPNAAAL